MTLSRDAWTFGERCERSERPVLFVAMKTVTYLSCVLLVLHGSVDVESRSLSRIVNGENAVPGRYPYMVSMRFAQTSQHICGGSIVSSQHVLTAAHCVSELNSPSEIFLVTGSISNAVGGERHEVREIRIHERYIGPPDMWQNDVAVLKLDKPLRFDATRRIVPLARTNVKPGSHCVITGWGYTQPGSVLTPTIMQTLNQTIVDVDTCRASHWELAKVTDVQLCGFSLPTNGICQGDSGGPLVCDGEQHGVTSWGILCAQGVPDVYARVPSFYDWIKERIQDVDYA